MGVFFIGLFDLGCCVCFRLVGCCVGFLIVAYDLDLVLLYVFCYYSCFELFDVCFLLGFVLLFSFGCECYLLFGGFVILVGWFCFGWLLSVCLVFTGLLVTGVLFVCFRCL